MATTIILKDWIKRTIEGVPYKRQPIHPAEKLRTELRKQKRPFSETVEIYEDVCLKIKDTAGCDGGAFFEYHAGAKTEMIVFKY